MQTTNFKSALVVGTVRNASANVVSDLVRIVDALEEILPTKAYVVESDSSDNTVARLSELAEKDSRIRFISLGVVAITIPGDALAANQSARYYDIFALRHPMWSPNDWSLEAQWLEPFLGKMNAKKHSMTDRMIHIPSTMPPIPVESAFGGLCIYRRWVFDQFDYLEDSEATLNENEHVTFHRKVRAAGGKIFIHPGLVNSKWTAHSLGARPTIKFLNSVAQVFPFRVLLPVLRVKLDFELRKI